MNKNNIYHEGELAVQQKTNVKDSAQLNGRIIAKNIPEGALHFIAQQAMLVLSSEDSNGNIWASVLFGVPGFIHARNEQTLELDLTQAAPVTEDPLWSNIKKNNRIGLILIELGTRRRLRINGVINKLGSSRYLINIEQAYPNCPKYIQRRHVAKAGKLKQSNSVEELSGSILNQHQQKLIKNSDTFFVASAHPEQGMDASHRGGEPGFVEVLTSKLLRIPDYPGNNMFNTLGNFQINSNAGLIFIDFHNKKLLQLTGHAEILWHIENSVNETGGTFRYWEFSIESWRERDIAFDIQWEYLEASPFNPLKHEKKYVDNELLLSVEKITQQAPHIKSFILKDVRNAFLPVFSPGANLEIKIKQNDRKIGRHYSILSNSADRSHYEIAVLEDPHSRGGSHFMHHQVKEGDVLCCDSPSNNFTMNEDAEHSILIAGGIGITPVLSMLQELSATKKSFEIHYTVKQKSDFIFMNRIKSLAGKQAYFYTSREQGSRLNLKAIMKIPDPGTHLYVCGPVRMIQAVREQADNNSWLEEQIHFESFGAQIIQQAEPVNIHLARSNQNILVPANKSILDCLLEKNIQVAHQCKRGECAMCLTKVIEGEPEHHDICLNNHERQASMCICVSRAKSKTLSLDL